MFRVFLLKQTLLTVLLGLTVIFSPVHAETSGTSTLGLADRVVEHRLKNGLTLLMVERHQAPIVSFSVVFRVGGVNEEAGSTGVAHLYEHLAFKGTKSIGTTNYRKESRVLREMDRVHAEITREEARAPGEDTDRLKELRARFSELQARSAEFVVKNELAEIYEQNGGVGLNASTGKDFTNYVVSLPSNRMELWAAIESDRMENPVLREFYKERDVVLEERRRRYENTPDGKLYEAFISAAFNAHPYRMPVIGWEADLKAMTREDAEAFFEKYYGPDNAVIAIVGDFDPKETIRLAEKYFSKIPARTPLTNVKIVEPPPAGEVRVEVEFDAEPEVLIGYRKPGMNHPDDAVFDVIDGLLSDGLSSRLYRTLVKEKKMVVNISTFTGSPGARYPHLFSIEAAPRAPHTTMEVESAVYAELERLKTDRVEARDLQKVLNRLDARRIRSLESNSGLASQLGYFHAVAGSWRYVQENRDRVASVTAEDVMRVAKKYLIKRNRVVATLVKKEKP